MKRIYLDYSATTPLLPEAKQAMDRVVSELFGNPSSVHWYGRQAKAMLEETRERIALLLDAQPDEIVFTSGGTEANALALMGTYFQNERQKKKTHIVISAIEHHSVLHTAEFLTTLGAEVTIVSSPENGCIDVNAVVDAIRPETSLVSVMLVNNEIGTIQSVQEIAQHISRKDVRLHTDAVQAVGKMNISFRQLGVDFLSFSAHKFYGPKGIGALMVRKGVLFTPLFHGGAQETNRRAGTENLPAIVGCAEALSVVIEKRETEWQRLRTLKDFFLAELQKRFQHILINGTPDKTIPHILSISFDSRYYSLDSDALLVGLDLRGIAASSGSACSSGSITPSHVIRAIGRDDQTARATLRFSLGAWTTKEDIETTLAVLEETVTASSRR